MAKDLVSTRRYVQKFYQMRTQLQAVGLRIQTLRSNQQMAEAMRLEPGQEVVLKGDETRIEITTSRWRPSVELLEFAERFSEKYDKTLRDLADS